MLCIRPGTRCRDLHQLLATHLSALSDGLKEGSVPCLFVVVGGSVGFAGTATRSRTARSCGRVRGPLTDNGGAFPETGGWRKYSVRAQS
jgi:hypothetical protein